MDYLLDFLKFKNNESIDLFVNNDRFLKYFGITIDEIDDYLLDLSDYFYVRVMDRSDTSWHYNRFLISIHYKKEINYNSVITKVNTFLRRVKQFNLCEHSRTKDDYNNILILEIYKNVYPESKITESKSNDYYRRITGDEWTILEKLYKYLTFSEKEKDLIRNEIDFYIIPRKSDHPYDEIHTRLLHPNFLNIYKLEDEWFIVSFNSYVYKCDQIEGLVRFINDYIKGKINKIK